MEIMTATPTAAQIAQARKVAQAWAAVQALPYSRKLGPERAAKMLYRAASGLLLEMCSGDHALADAALAAAQS